MADEQLVEQVADQIEEVAKATRRLTGREVGFFIAGAGIGIAGGFAAGYFVAGKRLETKYEKLAQDEIKSMRRHYQQKFTTTQDKPSINTVVKERLQDDAKNEGKKEAARAVQSYRGRPPQETGDVVVETSHLVQEEASVNVFAEDSKWDYDVEVSKRSREVPYIIHIDEFQENQPENTQITVTYYEVDDILYDDLHGTVIDDMDEAICLGNLGRWGHGSRDPNITYVRNEEWSIDYEIVRDTGSYADTVNKNLRHSSTNTNRQRRRTRRFDDD